MPQPRTNSNSTLRRPQEKQGKEVACLNEQRANGKEQRALSRVNISPLARVICHVSHVIAFAIAFIYELHGCLTPGPSVRNFHLREQLSFTHYMHRDCSDAKELEDDEIISDERLTKGTPPGEHVPIGSRIWLVSRVFATFALAFMRTCSLMHFYMATRTNM
jgi:hypothetical protein